MDLRIERTRKSIINAFIELRGQKPIEKITVKELADLAFINKATFYSHYKDIYDLSEQLEDESIQRILDSIPHPEYIVTRPKEGFHELAYAMINQQQLSHILFSGSRQTLYVERLEQRLKEMIFEQLPEQKNILELDLLLTVLIRGTFHAFMSHEDEDTATVLQILGNINECLVKNYVSVKDSSALF